MWKHNHETVCSQNILNILLKAANQQVVFPISAEAYNTTNRSQQQQTNQYNHYIVLLFYYKCTAYEFPLRFTFYFFLLSNCFSLLYTVLNMLKQLFCASPNL